jgi:hypothetical protein
MTKNKENNESIKKMKGISKLICNISKIGGILIKIAMGCTILAMIILPFIINKVEEVTDDTIIFNGKTYNYSLNDTILIIDDYKEINNDISVNRINNVIDMFQKKSNIEITIIAEIMFICLIISLLFTYMVVRKVYKLFDNIHKGDTPFIEENVTYIKQIAKMMIILLIFSKISDGIFGPLFNFQSESVAYIDLVEIVYVLVIFALAYVFEYGYKLQLEQDTTL